MAKVEIYTWATCPYCLKAKALLKQKGIDYKEYPIDGDNEARQAMTNRANGRRTLPQIFINDIGIGGCDELHALEKEQKFKDLLD